MVVTGAGAGGWEHRRGQELRLGYVHLLIQQIFTEGLLCAGHASRSADRGPGGREGAGLGEKEEA